MKIYPAILLGLSATLVVAGCGPVHLVANPNIPQPLVMKLPVGIALFMPKEFSEYVHREERWSTDWHVDLGKAQSEGIMRLLTAMFETVTPVDSINAGVQTPGVRAILEPSIEEYAFVTPRDAGSPFFAVSIKYRVNVYSPEGKLADSWGFTGYGTSPAQGLSSTAPLAAATALAMRDAGAKLAVEFREQAIVRGLMPEQIQNPPDAPAPEPAGEAAPAPTEESNTPAPATPAVSGEAPASESAAEPTAEPESEVAPEEAAEPGDEQDAPPQLEVEGFVHS